MRRTLFDPEWSETRVSGQAPIVSVASGAESLWVLTREEGERPRLESVCHERVATGWEPRFQVSTRLNEVVVLRDESVLIAGDFVSLHREENGWKSVPVVADLVRAWGSSDRCAYAIGRTSERQSRDRFGGAVTWVTQDIFFFDGERWIPSEFAQRGLPGFFCDGSCDDSGFGWTVGTHSTHSCMAKGRGTDWSADGCSSFYLACVDIASSTCGYVAGGDGLWRLVNGHWAPVDSYNEGQWVMPWPLALRVVNESPVVVVSSSETRERPSDHEFDVFVSGRWFGFDGPRGTARDRYRVGISAAGSLLLSKGTSVWESCPLDHATG